MMVLERVRDAFTSCVFHDDMNAVVVGGGIGEVPYFGGMITPSFASAGFLMHKDLRAKQCHWHGVKQEGPFQCLVQGQERIEVTRAHHVEHGVALRHKLAPMGWGEQRWESGETHHEMVIPHTDRTFSGAGAVHVGGAILQFHLF